MAGAESKTCRLPRKATSHGANIRQGMWQILKSGCDFETEKTEYFKPPGGDVICTSLKDASAYYFHSFAIDKLDFKLSG